MLRASLKGKYDTDKVSAVGTVTVNAGDVKLRATMTYATFVDGPYLNDLSVTLKKPDSFIVDYNVPKKDVRAMFMNSVKVLHKLLNLTYSHGWADNWNTLDGMLVLDSSNKLSANYDYNSVNGKVKYNYVHGGASTFEPSYDFAKNSWDFAVSQRVYADVFKATYQTSSRVLGLEWSRSSKFNGAFKEKTLPGPLSVRAVAVFQALEGKIEGGNIYDKHKRFSEGKDLTAQVSAETDAVSLFYPRTGSCKYGETFHYSHPDRYVHLSHGFVNPAASILQTIDPRLAQNPEIMASTTIK